MRVFTIRLKPGQDLFDSIDAFVAENKIEAGCLLSSVGSLTHAVLRFANRDDPNEFDGFYEIVSLAGTLSTNGCHIHISISDADGATIGGHLVSGCTIFTTAEIVVAALDDVIYKRELLKDDSGYAELIIYPSKSDKKG